MGTTTYTVIVSYQQDMEYVELAESADRAAIHVFAALIASHATPRSIAGVERGISAFGRIGHHNADYHK